MPYCPDPLRGKSSAIRLLAEQARRTLASDAPVLILGETGSGKGLLARWLHDNGPRAGQPFVDLDCGTLSPFLVESDLFGREVGAYTGAVTAKPGLLEGAHGGSVFLDEVGEAPEAVQPRLLKVLEEKRFRRLGGIVDLRVDIRLISATHRDLGALAAARRFRSDLYYRISTIPLRVPALRERLDDVPELAAAILAQLAVERGRPGIELEPRAIKRLQTYHWPGNIRQLRSTLEQAQLFCERASLAARDLRLDLLPALTAPEYDRRLTLDELGRLHIERVLVEERGRVVRAARRLGIPRSSLYEKLHRYGISILPT